jgi:hypothetical protein
VEADSLGLLLARVDLLVYFTAGGILRLGILTRADCITNLRKMKWKYRRGNHTLYK